MYIGNKVRNIKKNKNLILNNINYGRVIATRFYDNSCKNMLKEFIRLIFFDYEIKYIFHDSKILSIYSYRNKNRKDYDDIVDGFRNILDYQCDTLEFIYKLSLKECILKIKYLVKYIFKLYNQIENPIFTSIILSQFLRFESVLLKTIHWNKYMLCVTFCDAHGIENLTTQIASNKKIITATLQHGQYRVLKPETENADVESYENFISDYLFAWGEMTKKEFLKAGLDQNRIITVGAIKSFSNNTCLQFQKTKNVFGVVLDGNIYKESNIQMIHYANLLANKFDLKYIVRLHPKNNWKDYSKYCDSNKLHSVLTKVENYNYANKIDFSLVHMTGVFVELLSINSAIFLMEDEYLEELFKVEGSTFSNINELEELYIKYNKEQQLFLNKQYKLYRKFNQAGNIKENYQNAIKRIMKGTIEDET